MRRKVRLPAPRRRGECGRPMPSKRKTHKAGGSSLRERASSLFRSPCSARSIASTCPLIRRTLPNCFFKSLVVWDKGSPFRKSVYLTLCKTNLIVAKELVARAGLEPAHKSFDGSSLTSWVPRPLGPPRFQPLSNSTAMGGDLNTSALNPFV